MADSTESAITVAAPAATVMGVIADFEGYPSWAGVTSAEVLGTGHDGRAEQVRLVIDVGGVKDDYVLAYAWQGDERVSWHLVQGRLQKSQVGSYTLAPATGGASTEVTYRLAVEVSLPMIGVLRRKAERLIVDTALKGLKKRVESLP